MGAERRFQAHPQSASGDFYVVNHECLACGAPHAVAPDLIGWATTDEGQHDHCIWKKQPETASEWEQAFAAFGASEVGCYRYAGTDPAVIARIGPEYCDHPEYAPARPRRTEQLSREAPLPEVRFTLVDQGGFTSTLSWSGLRLFVRTVLHRLGWKSRP